MLHFVLAVSTKEKTANLASLVRFGQDQCQNIANALPNLKWCKPS